MAKKKNHYYAYVVGGTQGIVDSWDACAVLTHGKPARYKGFETEDEALEWLEAGAEYEDRAAQKAQARETLPGEAIYFDAGTGRGMGTEVRVTDRDGTPLTYMVIDESLVTREGNMRLTDRTNNYGELLGLYLALQVARKLGRKRILGDSKLVIEFWSRGYIRREAAADPYLRDLVDRTRKLRKEFEQDGGEVGRISGDVNPADLGFHR